MNEVECNNIPLNMLDPSNEFYGKIYYFEKFLTPK